MRGWRSGFLCLTLLAGFSAIHATADDFYVDATFGNDAFDGRSWGTAKATIGSAEDEASLTVGVILSPQVKVSPQRERRVARLRGRAAVWIGRRAGGQ